MAIGNPYTPAPDANTDISGYRPFRPPPVAAFVPPAPVAEPFRQSSTTHNGIRLEHHTAGLLHDTRDQEALSQGP